jgi:glyceraldehyde-3-phosphate dehydrogenase (NADP+)
MSNAEAQLQQVFPTDEAIPPHARPFHYEQGMRYLLDGAVAEWPGPCQEVRSPIHIRTQTGTEAPLLGQYPLMDEAQATRALEAAVSAYDRGCGVWPTMSVAERIGHVERFLPRMLAVRDEVVRLLMWEIGKSYTDSCREVDRTIEYIKQTITALKELDRSASRFVLEQGFLAQIRRSPLGVVLCMGPFNYPLNETFTTLIPALIMGNTVVFKPPRYGVLLHSPLLDAFAECFPRGVVNTVYGDGAAVVGPLMKSGRIDVLAFIGSARVAAILKHQHPRPNRLRCVLGLEAKNPAVVLPHADLDLAVRECVAGAFSFNGQRCTAIKIVFVHQAIAARFSEMVATAVEHLQIGMPWDENVAITPLAEDNKPEWLRQLVLEATSKGARIINDGGGAIHGSVFAPAVLFPASLASTVCQVEQFGPVLPIVPFTSDDEVLDWLIESPFGQQASLFGSEPEHLSRFIDPLANQVCRININSQCQRGPDSFPFTGRKDSAEGTLSISDALRVFSIRSLVAAKTTEDNERIITAIASRRLSNFLSTDFIL